MLNFSAWAGGPWWDASERNSNFTPNVIAQNLHSVTRGDVLGSLLMQKIRSEPVITFAPSQSLLVYQAACISALIIINCAFFRTYNSLPGCRHLRFLSRCSLSIVLHMSRNVCTWVQSRARKSLAEKLFRGENRMLRECVCFVACFANEAELKAIQCQKMCLTTDLHHEIKLSLSFCLLCVHGGMCFVSNTLILLQSIDNVVLSVPTQFSSMSGLSHSDIVAEDYQWALNFCWISIFLSPNLFLLYVCLSSAYFIKKLFSRSTTRWTETWFWLICDVDESLRLIDDSSECDHRDKTLINLNKHSCCRCFCLCCFVWIPM